MSGETKALIGIGLATLIILVGGIFFLSKSGTSTPNQASNVGQKVDQSVLIRDDSHKIEAKDAKVTVVEFLDYECEACGAAYPVVEKILKDYEGKINYVVRVMPLHNNSMLASKTAEAAAEQGKYWEMYNKLFQNQKEWAEKKTPQTEIFIKYAQELGLDMDKFKQGLENKAYEDKTNRDKADAVTAGVQGTPTFFINGTLAGNVMTYDQFKEKLDAELAK